MRLAEGDRMRGPKNRSRATSGSSSRGDAVALRTGCHCSVTPKAGRGPPEGAGVGERASTCSVGQRWAVWLRPPHGPGGR